MTTDSGSESTTELSLDDQDVAVLQDGGEDIRRLLASDAHAEDRLFRLLDKRLEGDFDSETWSRIYKSVTALMGEKGATLLGWATTVDPTPIEALDRHTPAEVVALLRLITATHGAELQSAYARWDQLPNNWRTVGREVHQDLLRNRALITLRVEKFNGRRSPPGRARRLNSRAGEEYHRRTSSCGLAGRVQRLPDPGVPRGGRRAHKNPAAGDGRSCAEHRHHGPPRRGQLTH